MLATHNSASGYPVGYPRYAHGIINLYSKCQSLTLEDQWDLGVRYFDFRVRKGKSGYIIVCHGLVNYDLTFSQALLKILQCQSACGRGELEPVYIRTQWDHTGTDGSDKEDVINNFNLMLEGFPSLRFTGLYEKGTGVLLCPGYHKAPVTIEKHGSTEGYWKYLPPFIYSLFHNKDHYSTYSEYVDAEDKYLMLDFIEQCTD